MGEGDLNVVVHPHPHPPPSRGREDYVLIFSGSSVLNRGDISASPSSFSLIFAALPSPLQYFQASAALTPFQPSLPVRALQETD